MTRKLFWKRKWVYSHCKLCKDIVCILWAGFWSAILDIHIYIYNIIYIHIFHTIFDIVHSFKTWHLFKTNIQEKLMKRKMMERSVSSNKCNHKYLQDRCEDRGKKIYVKWLVSMVEWIEDGEKYKKSLHWENIYKKVFSRWEGTLESLLPRKEW